MVFTAPALAISKPASIGDNVEKDFYKIYLLKSDNNYCVDGGSLKRTEVSTPIPMEYSTCVESRGEIWIISGDYGDCYKFDGQSFSSCGYTYVGHRKV